MAFPGQTAACHSSDTAPAVSYHRWKPGYDVPAVGNIPKNEMKQQTSRLSIDHNAWQIWVTFHIFLGGIVCILQNVNVRQSHMQIIWQVLLKLTISGQIIVSYYYPVHGAESAHNVVLFTFPEGQGSLSLGVLNEPVKFCKRTTKYGFIKFKLSVIQSKQL